MANSKNTKRAFIFRLFSLIALGFMMAAYFAPTWWVSLEAPQYPPEAFPDGIKINFHFDSVRNGCEMQERVEVTESESLNCKHEMDAINHFVGMYPIAAGGPVERAMSPFAMSILGLMILTFVMPSRRSQVVLFVAGSIAIASWMTLAYKQEGGVKYVSPGYIEDMVGAMELYPEDYADWSARDAIEEVYSEALGRYFREMDVINKRMDLMLTAADMVYYGLLASMVILILGLMFTNFTYWLLAAVPAMIPVFFLLEYIGWLWWFGHNMNEMGAFSLKPFMPTVLGEGKVAQFYTYSYPHDGFYMLLATSFLLILAILIRKRQLKDEG